MKIDLRPRHRNSGRPPEKDARPFLKWIRGRTCAFHFMGDCEGRVEAMHLDFAGGKGMGTKVADRYSLPCCAKHHRLQHDNGWITFMDTAKVSAAMLLDAADRLWRAWPGRAAWERKQGV